MKTRKSAATAALKPTDKTIKTPALAPEPPAPARSGLSALIGSETVPPRDLKTAVAPVSPPPLRVPAASPPKKEDPSPVAPAIIEVKADVGFGNAVFLRGTGSGLTWDRGVPLVCVDAKTWRWSQKVTSPVTFKVLLNDKVWASGSDLVVNPGQKLEVAPRFS